MGQPECVNLFVFVCCAEVSTGSVTKGEGRREREQYGFLEVSCPHPSYIATLVVVVGQYSNDTKAIFI